MANCPHCDGLGCSLCASAEVNAAVLGEPEEVEGGIEFAYRGMSLWCGECNAREQMTLLGRATCPVRQPGVPEEMVILGKGLVLQETKVTAACWRCRSLEGAGKPARMSRDRLRDMLTEMRELGETGLRSYLVSAGGELSLLPPVSQDDRLESKSGRPWSSTTTLDEVVRAHDEAGIGLTAAEYVELRRQLAEGDL